MSEPATVDMLCAEAERYIRDAAGMLERGEHVQLIGLDEKVKILCQAIAGMPVEQGKKYVAHLDALRRQLDVLKQLMQDQQKKIREQVATLDMKRRANQAYAKSKVMTRKPLAEE